MPRQVRTVVASKPEAKSAKVEEVAPPVKSKAQPKPKTPAKPKVQPPAEEVEEVEEPKTKQRTFKLLVDSVKPPIDPAKFSDKGGRYSGRAPGQACKKAFTQIVRKCYDKKPCEFDFTIREMTAGSDHKEFSYHGKRSVLATPRVVSRKDKKNGKEVTYTVEFETTIKSLKEGKSETVVKQVAPVKTKAKAKPKPPVEEIEEELVEEDVDES